MIEPLRKMEEFGSRDEAEAARLLRTLEPAAPSPMVEQRVYASLARPPRLGPRALRFVSVASVSMVATGAFALGLGMILHREAEPRTPMAPVSPPVAASTALAAPVPSVVPQPEPTAIFEAPAPVRAETRTRSRVPAPRALPAERRRTQTPVDSTSPPGPVAAPSPAVDPVETTEARVAAAPPEEAALVLAGLRALRRQHDPAQAGVLLARYLDRFPQGALVQEALAIAIEADLARGDRKAAAQLAEQYLDRFPTGRFVRLARKASDGTGP